MADRTVLVADAPPASVCSSRCWWPDEGRDPLELPRSGRESAQTDPEDALPTEHACGALHDINNLLGVILLTTEMLMNNEHHPDSADLSLIKEAAIRAAQISRRTMAKAKAAREGARGLTDANSLLSALVPILESVCGQQVEIVTTRNAADAMVSLDPTCLERVIVNLVTNARDASPKGGVVRVTTRNVCTQGKAPNGQGSFAARHLVIDVQDEGAGIPEAIRDRIFEPFFSTKSGRGTGLGLANVLSIAEAAGGCVSVESEIGRGTRFSVSLPVIDGSLQ